MSTTAQNLIDALKKLPPDTLVMAYDEDTDIYIDLDYSEIHPYDMMGERIGFLIQAASAHEPFA